MADIHFDYKVALAVAEEGADKIRINPGNIGGPERVRAVADACRSRGIPIRIGVNGGSLERELLAKYGAPTAEALVESALGHIRLLEDCGFEDICVLLKSSDVGTNIQAYRLMHQRTDFPLHLGVTEAGTRYMGTLKSAAAFGALLLDGIGDTVRVSLTADPVEEVVAAKAILKALGLNEQGATLVSCPTCGRTRLDLDPHCRRGGTAAGSAEKPHHGGGDGLRSQRPRGSPGGGSGSGLRHRGRAAVCQRTSFGKGARRADRRRPV